MKSTFAVMHTVKTKKTNTPMRKLNIGHVLTFIVSGLLSWLLSFSFTLSVENSQGAAAKVDYSAQISKSTGLAVLHDSEVWLDKKPSKELLAPFFQRKILFLASQRPGVPADLYSASVRAVEGRGILAIRNVVNLSKSLVGDEYKIIAAPPLVAVATRVLGQTRSWTLYDFSPQELPEGEEWTVLTRLLARVSSILETGRADDIGISTVRFVHPPRDRDLEMSIESGQLQLFWFDIDEDEHSAIVRVPAVEENSDEIVVVRKVRLAKRPILWLVDTIRSFSWIGPGPIEWAEGRFFALADFVRQQRYQFSENEDEEEDGGAEVAQGSASDWNLSKGLEIGGDELVREWPPPPFEPPVFSRRIKGEGVWKPDVPGFIRTLPGAPPMVYRSVTRPDLERPYVKVELFAMDMRQLELHMVAGHEDPQPTTGSCGTGRIPRRKDILERLVLAFNGAFKTEHGAYGMMVEKDVLLPPQAEAATVASFDDGSSMMGSWPKGASIPEEMTSFRQNMDPLVENGVVNPKRRYLWGFTLDEDITKMHTIRSGICMTRGGHLVYAWGADLTATTLGKAMNTAGCVYGIHLDMNPFHTSYIFYRFKKFNESETPRFESHLPLPDMRYSPYRYVNGAPKDFFFLTLRDSSPGPGWNATGLAQPAPAFLPAVFKRTIDGTNLIAVDMTRTRAVLTPGGVPSYLSPAKPDKESPEESRNVLVSIDIGQWSSARGQITGGALVATMEENRATIGIEENGRLHIGVWSPEDLWVPVIKDAIQVDWAGLASTSRGRCTMLGLMDDKWLLIGDGVADQIMSAMREQGVRRILVLPKSNEASAIFTRRESGLTDLSGHKVDAQERNRNMLHLTAKPRSMSMSRLEKVLVSVGGK